MHVVADTPPAATGTPEWTSEALIAEIRGQGGRVYRLREQLVFCLTNNPELAEWLVEIGGQPYAPNGHTGGAYPRARDGSVEFDIYLQNIPVNGPSLWECLQ